MSSEIIQVRDVPAEDVTILRQRAASRGVSLSSYLRDLIHNETSRPEMADVIARISTRQPVGVTSDAVRSYIDDNRV